MMSNLPYKHCLNCGTELKGMYCHACGQEAVDKAPSVGHFVLEYFNHAFVWDTKFFHTIWNLIRSPGYLTNEFLSGKFVSHEHPLKLNMFLLLVFATLFLIFSGTEKLTRSVHDFTNDERLFPSIQMETLMGKQEYARKLLDGPRDTVRIAAPLFLAEEYSEVIENVGTIEDTGEEALDKWIAVLPQVMIDDRIIVSDSEGYYIFNAEVRSENDGVQMFNSIWAEMVNLFAKYLPLIVLFTAPFLTMALRFVQRKRRLPRINHFIFALHYTAFLELLMLGIFILYLIVSPPLGLLQCILIIGSWAYLTMAFHHVYKMETWLKSVMKALLISFIYMLICLMMFFGIFVIACFIVVAALL